MRIFKVRSDHIAGYFYTVRVDENGLWACNCLDFLIRGRFKVVCKHIKRTMQELSKTAA